jgi:hypothetical protein
VKYSVSKLLRIIEDSMVPFSRFFILRLFIFLSGLLASCEFQPNDIPDANIEKPSETGPAIVINLNDYNDTIKLGYTTDFKYAISGTTNKIIAVKISIGGRIIHDYLADSQQTFSFTFDPATVPDGIYILDIQITTSTGSRSIAEKLGMEAYLYNLYWPVIIDKAIPEGNYNITFEKVHDPEGLKLSWPKFDHANCIKYVIYRRHLPFQQEPVPIAEVNDPKISYYIDHSFREGQDALYFVRIITPYGYYDGITTPFGDNLTGVLSAEWHNNGTLDVTWDKARNLETFDSYYVFTSYSDTPMESYIIGDPEENHVTFLDAGFAYGISVYLAIVPKGLNVADYENLRLYKYTHYTPAEIPLFIFPTLVNDHEFMLLSRPEIIYRYFPDEQKTEDSISVNLTGSNLVSVSSNGNRFVYFQNGSFYIRKTDDFSIETVFTDPSIPYPESVSCLSISDNNRLLAADNWNNIYLYNSDTRQLIIKDSINLLGLHKKTALLSPDGTKMTAITGVWEVSFFSLESSGWMLTGKQPVYPTNIFYSKDGAFVYLVTYNKVIKCRTSDFGIVSDNTIPEGYIRSVDIDRGHLLCSSVYGPEYNIIDFESGEILKTLHLYGVSTIFKNHIIYSGRQINLSQF